MDKTYRIADFATLARPAVYADNHYFALTPLRAYPELCEGMSVNGLLILFGLKGTVSLTAGGHPYSLTAGSCLVCPPNTMLKDVSFEGDTCTVLLGFSMEILVRMLTGSDRVLKVIKALTTKPVISNDERYNEARLSTFLMILRYRNASNDLYHDELVYHLFATMLFDVINDFHIPGIRQDDNAPDNAHYRTEHLYKEFLTLLSKTDGRIRTVGYFADKLYITPKYLSKITNQYAGRPALDIITSHAVERLKIELRYTDHPMKDIADDFRFESYPTFCKFVKKHLGVTPQQYRKEV